MPSSTIDKALSSTKSFIETFTSSDNPTTTFTEHTIESVTSDNGILPQILKFVSQPKFKWYILGLLLCIVAFVYFKFQNKKPKPPVDEPTKEPAKNEQEGFNVQKHEIETSIAERDKLWISKINEMKQDFTNQLAIQADVNSQLIAQLNNAKKHQYQKTHSTPRAPQQTQQPTIIKQHDSEQLTETSNSEEIFIEDKNVMEHNLTAEEMNAIDKQLEDVNLDHLMHASD
jgi:hypothetical protein